MEYLLSHGVRQTLNTINYQYRYLFDAIPILTATVEPYFITLQWQPQWQTFVAIVTPFDGTQSIGIHDISLKRLKRSVNRFLFQPEILSQAQFERMLNAERSL